MGKSVLPFIATSHFLMAQWDAEANPDIDPATTRLGSHKRARWVCPVGHRWPATIGARGRGSGCPDCARERTRKLDFVSQHPRMMSEFVADLNPGIDPSTISQGSSVMLVWRCAEGHEWSAPPTIRRTSNCRSCAGKTSAKKRWAGEKSMVSDVPELLARWAEPDIDPATVPLSSRVEYRWRCPAGHETLRRPGRNPRAHACAECSGRVATPERNLVVDNQPLANDWHPDKNDREPHSVLATSHYLAWWLGECGHEWQREVYVRNRGQGCPFCYGLDTHPDYSVGATSTLLTSQWHADKNDGLTPFDVSPGSNTVVWWQCEYGHEWQTAVANRALAGTGCPKCKRLKKRSVREVRLAHELAYIFDADAEVHHVDTDKGEWSTDFAAPAHRLIVEYDGSYYHSRDGYLERDTRKTDALLAAGWTVIRVREKPLALINDWDVSAPDTGNIRPVVDAVLDAIVGLRPDLASLPDLVAYRAGKGTRAHGHADKTVARIRKAQRTA